MGSDDVVLSAPRVGTDLKCFEGDYLKLLSLSTFCSGYSLGQSLLLGCTHLLKCRASEC